MQNMNQQPQQGMHPAYGNFFSDPTAQMAFQVGGRATEAAGAYVEQNVGFPTLGPTNGMDGWPVFRFVDLRVRGSLARKISTSRRSKTLLQRLK